MNPRGRLARRSPGSRLSGDRQGRQVVPAGSIEGARVGARTLARAGLRTAGVVQTCLDLMGIDCEYQDRHAGGEPAETSPSGTTGPAGRPRPARGLDPAGTESADPSGEDLPALILAIDSMFARLEAQVGRLDRVNYHGRTVSLAGGVAAAAGVIGAALQPRRVARRRGLRGELARGARLTTAAAMVAGASAAAAGLLDDLDQGAHDGDAPAKGLRGHLTALAHGHLTTGVAKIGLIGAGAVVAGSILTRACGIAGTGLTGGGSRAGCTLPGTRATGAPSPMCLVGETAVRAVTIASWANVHNLLDLRPGRTLKVAGGLSIALLLAPRPRAAEPVVAVACAGRILAAGSLGVIGASAPTDLTERTMLGDTGANAVGALVGTVMACLPSRRARLVAAVAGTALVLASEKVSYSAVISRHRLLAGLDRLGRREEP